MRRFLALTALAVAVLAVGAARPALATPPRDLLSLDIPFAFHAGEAKLPAGNYVVVRLDTTDPGPLAIRSADGKIVVDLVTENSNLPTAPEKTHLSFNVLGQEHFLSQVRMKGEAMGWDLQKPRAERRLEMRGEKATVVNLDIRASG